MDLEHVVWSHTSTTYAATMEVNINLMWQNSQHTGVFTKDMNTIIKAPTSLTCSKFIIRVQGLTKHKWKFSNLEVVESWSSMNISITFKSRMFNVINLFSKACHHMVHPVPKNPNGLCEDQDSLPSIYRKRGSCKWNSTCLVTNLRNEDKFHIRIWWS